MNKIFCMDVDYREDYAVAAGILFDDWESDNTLKELTVKIDEIAPYESGQFYKRELPCLLQLIESLNSLPDIFIVDSFVYLDENKKPGLGGYLFQAFNEQIPVIGVAKSNFKDSTNSSEVLRGDSQNPLYVTSAGIDLNEAADLIKTMHGEFRNPTLLKKVDQLCRSGNAHM